MNGLNEIKYEDIIIQYDIKQAYNIVIRPIENNISVNSGTILTKDKYGILNIYDSSKSDKIYGISLKKIEHTNNDFIPVLVKGVINSGWCDEKAEDLLEEVGIYTR